MRNIWFDVVLQRRSSNILNPCYPTDNIQSDRRQKRGAHTCDVLHAGPSLTVFLLYSTLHATLSNGLNHDIIPASWSNGLLIIAGRRSLFTRKHLHLTAVIIILRWLAEPPTTDNCPSSTFLLLQSSELNKCSQSWRCGSSRSKRGLRQDLPPRILIGCNLNGRNEVERISHRMYRTNNIVRSSKWILGSCTCVGVNIVEWDLCEINRAVDYDDQGTSRGE